MFAVPRGVAVTTSCLERSVTKANIVSSEMSDSRSMRGGAGYEKSLENYKNQ